MSELSIKVSIGERIYPLKIRSEDEENVRKAAQRINERLLEYETKFGFADRKDALAMIALEFSVDLLSEQVNGPGLEPRDQNLIQEIEQKLDDILKNTLG